MDIGKKTHTHTKKNLNPKQNQPHKIAYVCHYNKQAVLEKQAFDNIKIYLRLINHYEDEFVTHLGVSLRSLQLKLVTCLSPNFVKKQNSQ